MHWYLPVTTLLLTWLLWISFALFSNYMKARSTTLPIIISPVWSQNIFWLLFQRQIIPIWRLLPQSLSRCTRCNYMGWQFEDKHRLHEELGPAFIVVSPSKNELILADADAISTVFSQRTRFIKPSEMYSAMDIFGPNVNTIEGEEWIVHRKVANSAFNENTITTAWSEALAQAKDMLQSWVTQQSKGVTGTTVDIATVALHVFTHAGFGIKYSYSEGVGTVAHGDSMSYRDALQSCLRNIIFLAILPDKILNLSCFPRSVRRIGQASQQLRQRMKEMIMDEEETDRRTTTNNLMSAVVQTGKEEDLNSNTRRLTNDEVIGNVFMYNLAGYETTSGTLSYAIFLLALYPQWQQWLTEELRKCVPDGPSADSYRSTFPQLKRCMAIMYETLRLYPPTPFVPKSTGAHKQTLSIGNKDVTIPEDTYVYINTQAAHCDPQTWGKDSLEWRPGRWLVQDKTTGEENFIQTPRGAFIPWADGPRACPGRNFAQAEFVGVIASLFREHCVRPSQLPNEEKASARRRLKDMIDNSAITAITLQMKNPHSVALIWEQKSL